MKDEQDILEEYTMEVEQEQPGVSTTSTIKASPGTSKQTKPEASSKGASPGSSKQTKPETAAKGPGKQPALKKKKQAAPSTGTQGAEATKLQKSIALVKARFKRGCECHDKSCFRGLKPESVYKHRLNIAELTKAERDMYLMGVTMACLGNPDETNKHKERRRLRAQYVHRGRRVCLDAFVYLENCTQYQLKKIRKHVMTHGVAPKLHGNHGRKPANTFSLDVPRRASEFLKRYLEKLSGEAGICDYKQVIRLSGHITKRDLHNAYKKHERGLEPGIQLMSYGAFVVFMCKQFPYIKFDAKKGVKQQQRQVQEQAENSLVEVGPEQQIQTIKQQQIENHSVVPLVDISNASSTTYNQQDNFILTPVPYQVIPSGNVVTLQNPNDWSTFVYERAG